jgi:hypothetical protein
MQLHRIGGAEDAPGRHLLVDLSATGFSDWSAAQGGRTNAYYSFPSWLSRGARFGPIFGVEVIALYDGLVRLRASLQPALRSYNCGVCRLAAYRTRGNRRLGDTCMAPQFTGS